MKAGELTIGAAAEAVGLTAATLRAWERRYGVPSPARSAGGYRRYDPAALAELVQMRALLDAGVRPKRAAAIVRGEARHDVFEDAVERALDAIAAFDSVQLHTLLRGVGALAAPVAIFDRLIAPVLARLDGARFELAHAHFTTESMHAAAYRLLHTQQPKTPRASAVLACFEGEQHVLPLMRLAFRLMDQGVQTLVLGARTPAAALGPVVAQRRPDAIGLSVTVPPPAAQVADRVQTYAQVCGDTRWAVGGQGALAIQAQVEAAGGHVVASSAAFEALLAQST